MGIDIATYRARIGTFYAATNSSTSGESEGDCVVDVNAIVSVWLLLLILRAGDVETNPGPFSSKYGKLSIHVFLITSFPSQNNAICFSYVSCIIFSFSQSFSEMVIFA